MASSCVGDYPQERRNHMHKIVAMVSTEELIREAEEVQHMLGFKISVELTTSKSVLEIANRTQKEGSNDRRCP